MRYGDGHLRDIRDILCPFNLWDFYQYKTLKCCSYVKKSFFINISEGNFFIIEHFYDEQYVPVTNTDNTSFNNVPAYANNIHIMLK